MNKFLLTLILSAYACLSAFAGTCVIEGVYDVQFDKTLNGKIDPGFIETQIKFKKNTKYENRFSGKYVNPYRKHVYRGICDTLQKSVISMTYNDMGNGYYSAYALTEIGDHKFKGAWTDVRGNTGDYVMTRSSAPAAQKPAKAEKPAKLNKKKDVAVKGGKYLRIDKSEYSVVKDGVVKVYFDLPGHLAQQVCVTHNDGKVIRCSMHETSKKKKGSVDFYIPQPPGEYKIVLFYYEDNITDQKERNRLLETPRQTLKFKALP